MLIRTKLQAPLLNSRLLYRKHLIRRLCAAEGCPLILISGPAGSGKTSLACQWIKQNSLKVAWYSLDEEDNVPDLFFRYLLTTLIQAEKQLERHLGLLLTNKRELTCETVIPNLIESLFHLPVSIRLILDDFHQIENEEIHAALARLIQYIPARLQLAVLSRVYLPVPMDAVALKKERVEISASDLKFTQQESAELFKNVIPLSFSADQIRDLNQHIEGWAAGLQLIGLLVGSKGNISDLSPILNQAHKKVSYYLIHDILSRQSEQIKNFIFTTALLERFTPELCAEVTGAQDADGILAQLERMNLFLIPLDTQGRWYRYHHMFSEVIRRQVSLETPGLILATLRKAALWLAADNHLEDALRSALKFNDFEFAADLMEDYLPQYIRQIDPTAGLRWILKLPPGILKQRTLLRLYQCTFLLILVEISDLKEILAAIESRGSMALERYPVPKRLLCEDFILYFKCMLRILHIERSEDTVKIKMLSGKISAKNQLFSVGIEMLMALVLISKGDLSLAEASLARVSSWLAAYEMMGKKIYLAKSEALIARHRGRLHQAEAILGRVLEDLDRQENGNTSMAFLLHRHLGHIFYLQNRLSEARECAAIAVRHCEYSGLLDDILAASELRLLLHLAARENEQAAECIQQMRAYSVRLGMPQITASADLCAARIAVSQGNLGAAVLWSQRRDLKPDDPFSLLFANECLTQARLLYAREQYPGAVHLLETLRRRCLKRDLLELVLQIDIFYCAVLHAMNQYGKATSLLSQALFFSETEGYVRPFVDNSREIAPILRRLEDELPRASLPVHFEKIFAACDIPLERTTALPLSESAEHKDLTRREIEILKLMAQGFQNKEIAHKAFISTNTVKSHVRNILSKLGGKTGPRRFSKPRNSGLSIRIEIHITQKPPKSRIGIFRSPGRFS